LAIFRKPFQLALGDKLTSRVSETGLNRQGLNPQGWTVKL
jgi:hypothetical protein